MCEVLLAFQSVPPGYQIHDNLVPEDLRKIWLYDKSPLDIGERDSLFRHITEMTILTVNCIVEFCKHLTGFSSLDKEDQIVILKECSSEIMMLKAARRYI